MAASGHDCILHFQSAHLFASQRAKYSISQSCLRACRGRSGSHPDLRSLGSLQSSPSGSGQLSGLGVSHARRRSSGTFEDDVFGAAGGLEMGSDPSEAATARHASMMASSSQDSLTHVESRGSIASGIGDLPPGEPPSRTLLIRNIQPAISDEALQATFAVGADLLHVPINVVRRPEGAEHSMNMAQTLARGLSRPIRTSCMCSLHKNIMHPSRCGVPYEVFPAWQLE